MPSPVVVGRVIIWSFKEIGKKAYAACKGPQWRPLDPYNMARDNAGKSIFLDVALVLKVVSGAENTCRLIYINNTN